MKKRDKNPFPEKKIEAVNYRELMTFPMAEENTQD